MNPQTKESDHFIINHYNEAPSTINEVLETLENNYKRITSLLQVVLPEKSVLYIYPSIEAFHQAIGETDIQDWRAGRFDNGTIKMVSPNNPGTEHDYNSIMAIAIHELVHLAAAEVNRHAPDYIAEGVATYLAGQDENIGEFIASDIKSGDFPTMAQLRSMTDEIYHYGYAFIDYVVYKYGYDGMLKLYKTADIKKAFDIDDDEFHKSWKAYLIEAFLIEVG